MLRLRHWVWRRPVLSVGIACGVLVGFGVLIGSPTVATSGPLVVVVVDREVRQRRERARERRLVTTFPSVVDRLIQHLRGGRSLAQSCAHLVSAAAAPGAGTPDVSTSGPWGSPELADALSPMTEALRRRQTLEEAAAALHGHRDTSVRLFAVTLQVLAVNGGPAVPALQRLRYTLIGTVHGREQMAAQAAQSLASAGLMIVSPVLVAFTIGALSRDAAHLYLFDVVGALCVFSAVALSALGWWWLGRDVARLERRIG